MRLIDVTNSFSHLVSQQLAHTDAQFVKVLSLGQTTVVFSEALKHRELLFTNDKRNIQPAEIDFTLDKLLSVDRSQANVIMGHHLAEVSVPVPTPTVEV